MPTPDFASIGGCFQREGDFSIYAINSDLIVRHGSVEAFDPNGANISHRPRRDLDRSPSRILPALIRFRQHLNDLEQRHGFLQDLTKNLIKKWTLPQRMNNG